MCIVYQLPSEEEVLKQKLREEARAVFLQRRSRQLLDNDELQVRLLTSRIMASLSLLPSLTTLAVRSTIRIALPLFQPN